MKMNLTEAGATAASKVASVVTYGGSASAAATGVAGAITTETVFGFTPDEWTVIGVVGGLLIGFLGFCVNVYFKHQHLLIAERNHQADPDE